ncbi:MAG: terminase family protein [Acidobacteriaceae bacterium]|nr:terminase family protein [Acidobacteriaceae bacterium]
MLPSLRRAQAQVFNCPKRFRVLVAGRRFGKTHLALWELLRAASPNGTLQATHEDEYRPRRRKKRSSTRETKPNSDSPHRLVWYVAPTYRQAKSIAWERLKSITRPWWLGHPHETDLNIRLRWGSTIGLRGADRYDSLRGQGLDFVVLDEYASMRPECWTEVLRPALSDRQGGALFIGTPQGFNHFHERFEHAQQDPEWAAFQFTTAEGGNVTPDELVSASRELDERCFRQEFEARFDNLARGLAYYAFDRNENVQPVSYQPGEPLIWSLDFNVDPMCSIVAQRYGASLYVLDEIVLPDANTPAACAALLERIARFRTGREILRIHVYGDASGNQRRTSAVATDWALIREFFANRSGQFTVAFRAPAANPVVRDRINCVNALLCSASGDRRLFIDPRCRELIRDLEQVRWQSGPDGQSLSELDKTDRLRTHLSDALGYYISQGLPIRGTIGERQQGPIW